MSRRDLTNIYFTVFGFIVLFAWGITVAATYSETEGLAILVISTLQMICLYLCNTQILSVLHLLCSSVLSIRQMLGTEIANETLKPLWSSFKPYPSPSGKSCSRRATHLTLLFCSLFYLVCLTVFQVIGVALTTSIPPILCGVVHRNAHSFIRGQFFSGILVVAIIDIVWYSIMETFTMPICTGKHHLHTVPPLTLVHLSLCSILLTVLTLLPHLYWLCSVCLYYCSRQLLLFTTTYSAQCWYFVGIYYTLVWGAILLERSQMVGWSETTFLASTTFSWIVPVGVTMVCCYKEWTRRVTPSLSLYLLLLHYVWRACGILRLQWIIVIASFDAGLISSSHVNLALVKHQPSLIQLFYINKQDSHTVLFWQILCPLLSRLNRSFLFIQCNALSCVDSFSILQQHWLKSATCLNLSASSQWSLYSLKSFTVCTHYTHTVLTVFMQQNAIEGNESKGYVALVLVGFCALFGSMGLFFMLARRRIARRLREAKETRQNSGVTKTQDSVPDHLGCCYYFVLWIKQQSETIAMVVIFVVIVSTVDISVLVDTCLNPASSALLFCLTSALSTVTSFLSTCFFCFSL